MDDTTHLLLLDGLVDQEGCTEGSLLRNLRRREVGSRVSGLGRARTCFASTAWVNSGEKATWVIETSSRTMLKRRARRVRFSRTSLETYVKAARKTVSICEFVGSKVGRGRI